MGIQRFDWDEFSMLTDSEGDYVRFADHEQVISDYDKAVNASHKVIVEKLEEIDRLRAALAATGKQQAGESATASSLLGKEERPRSPIQMADALERIAGGALADYEGCEADELHILRCAKLIRALAARQPVGQEPVRTVNADEAPFGLTTAEKVAWARGANDAIKEYAAPPAQGIDGLYRQIWEATMDAAGPAMDIVQNNPDLFEGATPGADKLAIVCREFVRMHTAATEKVRVGEVQGSREQFEAWANGRDLSPTPAGEYVSCYVQNDWEVWQAALASAQGVDLAQFSDCVLVTLRQMPHGSKDRHECWRLLALIDGRDAGTGVGGKERIVWLVECVDGSIIIAANKTHAVSMVESKTPKGAKSVLMAKIVDGQERCEVAP